MPARRMTSMPPWKQGAPPPVATTAGGPAATSASTAASMRRNASSPSRSNSSGMVAPADCSISRSRSMNGRFSRAASSRPTAVLPAAMKPTRKTGRTTDTRTAYPLLAAQRGAVGDLRRDEHQYFRPLVVLAAALEEPAEHRQVAEERDLAV